MKYRVIALATNSFKLQRQTLRCWFDVTEPGHDPYRLPEPVLFSSIDEAECYARSLHDTRTMVVSEFEV